MKSTLILVIIIVVGIYLRITNISPYKFYPDSYQNLVVAENLKNCRNVVCQMGDGGMVYPDFFMWTRPIYPLLINFAEPVLGSSESSAIYVATLFSILAIPLAYLLLKSIFKSNKAGLIGAALLATSFNHAAWSGFILTEATGIFFALLFLYFIFRKLDVESKIADVWDLATGVVYALAVFSRYEYIILMLPSALLIHMQSKKPVAKLVNIMTGLIVVGSIFFSFLFPTDSIFSVVYSQSQRLVLIAVGLLFLFTVIFVIYSRLSKNSKDLYLSRFSNFFLAAIYIFFAYIFMQSVFDIDLGTLGLMNFFETDLLLSIFILLGITFMLRKRDLRVVAIFAMISTIILAVIYLQINPKMHRYGAHLLPYLLIPATYGLFRLSEIVKTKGSYNRTVFAVFLIILFAFQLNKSQIGLKNWDDGIWFRTSYEEKSAKYVKDNVDIQDKVIIASFPEPYFFFIQNTTHSISDILPYIYISDELNEKEAIIVADMGMHDIFPEFSKFIESNLQENQISEYWVGEPYRYTTSIKPETQPVKVYKIKIADLKYKIEN